VVNSRRAQTTVCALSRDLWCNLHLRLLKLLLLSFWPMSISQQRKKRAFGTPKTFLCSVLAQCQEGSDIVCALQFLSPCILNSHKDLLDLGMVSCPYLLTDSPSPVVYMLHFLCTLCQLCRHTSCWGLTRRPATQHPTAARSPVPFPLSRIGRRMEKWENLWVEIKTV